ncbi:MAG: GyrI-like domain-containing protein [Dietzia sp.]
MRRMFSSLAGMPVSEYVRRRRMTVAAGDLLGEDDLLTIAVRYGYGSVEAFGRAFRAVHGVSHGDVRRDGGALRSQSVLRFRLTVEGSHPMDVRIIDRPVLRLVGHATRVPLIYEGVNHHIRAHVESIPVAENARLKALSSGEPTGLLQITHGTGPDDPEGTDLTYLHGVATDPDTPVPADLDVMDVPAGAWAVFRSSGDHPSALQQMWAATASEWFPSTPWRLRPGPSVLAVLDHSADFTRATCELWLPVKPQGVPGR